MNAAVWKDISGTAQLVQALATLIRAEVILIQTGSAP